MISFLRINKKINPLSGGAPNEVSAGVGNNILVDVFTHPMIPLREIITPPKRGYKTIPSWEGRRTK
jgi:hypothetical protein